MWVYYNYASAFSAIFTLINSNKTTAYIVDVDKIICAHTAVVDLTNIDIFILWKIKLIKINMANYKQ